MSLPIFDHLQAEEEQKRVLKKADDINIFNDTQFTDEGLAPVGSLTNRRNEGREKTKHSLLESAVKEPEVQTTKFKSSAGTKFCELNLDRLRALNHNASTNYLKSKSLLMSVNSRNSMPVIPPETTHSDLDLALIAVRHQSNAGMNVSMATEQTSMINVGRTFTDETFSSPVGRNTNTSIGGHAHLSSQRRGGIYSSMPELQSIKELDRDDNVSASGFAHHAHATVEKRLLRP